jgi:hypothetical protein
MPPADSASAPILCDSCGRPAAPEHIHDRLARLELATRYRPIHISLLLVCAAPPRNAADDFYAWEGQAAGPDALKFIEALMTIFAISTETPPAEQLAELQHQGVYLARLVECPLDSERQFNNLAQEYGPVLVKRIAYSYKPRRVALLAPVAPGLAEILNKANLSATLVSNGQGIEIPTPDDSDAIARARAIFTAAPESASAGT